MQALFKGVMFLGSVYFNMRSNWVGYDIYGFGRVTSHDLGQI